MTPVQAVLYVSRFCVLCKVLAPGIRRWFGRRGLAVEVRRAPAGVPTPALVVGDVALVGAGILRALRATERR